MLVKCDRCYLVLTEPGALVFSPPEPDGSLCSKFHLCEDCWNKLRGWLWDSKETEETGAGDAVPQQEELLECQDFEEDRT